MGAYLNRASHEGPQGFAMAKGGWEVGLLGLKIGNGRGSLLADNEYKKTCLP